MVRSRSGKESFAFALNAKGISPQKSRGELSFWGRLSGGILYSSYKRSFPRLLDTHARTDTRAHEEKILPLSIIMSPERKGACNHLDNTISTVVEVEFQTLKYTFCIQN